MPTRSLPRLALALAAATLSWGAQAAPGDAPGAWTLGMVAGRAVDSNLFDIVPQGLGGDLKRVDSHLYGGLVRRELPAPGWLADWGVSTSVELTVAHATGIAHNTDVALDWRPALSLWQFDGGTLDLAWGFGLLHSFGEPWSDYVDPDRPRGYRNFVHMAPELVLRWGPQREWGLGLRVHHRSGMYGLLAPRRVGANYPAVTLTRQF